MKKLLIICSVFFVFFKVYGEENLLYQHIQQAKLSNIDFEHISVFKKIGTEKRISDKFTNVDDVICLEASTFHNNTSKENQKKSVRKPFIGVHGKM